MNDKNVYKKIKWYHRLLYIVPAVVLAVSSFFSFFSVGNISASAIAFSSGFNGESVVDLFAPDYISITYTSSTLSPVQTLLTDFSGVGGVNVGAVHPSDDSTLDLYASTSQIGNGNSSSSLRVFNKTLRVNSDMVTSTVLVSTSSSANTASVDWGSWQYRYTTNMHYPVNNSGTLKVEFYWDTLFCFLPSTDSFTLPTVSIHKSLTQTSFGFPYSFNVVGGTGSDGVVSCTGSLYNEYGLVSSELKGGSLIFGSTTKVPLLPLFDDESVSGSLRIYRNLSVVFTLDVSTSAGAYLLIDSSYTKPLMSFTNVSYYMRIFNMNSFDTGLPVDVNRDYVSWLAGSVGSFLDMELLPGFTLGGVFFTIVAILLALYFLKLFAGG